MPSCSRMGPPTWAGSTCPTARKSPTPDRRQEDDGGSNSPSSSDWSAARRDHVPHGWWHRSDRHVEEALFAELSPRSVGSADQRRPPRMVSCQAEGCAPISTAWEAGKRFAEPFLQRDHRCERPCGCPPAAVGDFMILDAVNESGGQARSSVPSRHSSTGLGAVPALEGIAFAPGSQVHAPRRARNPRNAEGDRPPDGAGVGGLSIPALATPEVRTR